MKDHCNGPVLVLHKRDGHIVQRFESANAASNALGMWPDQVARSVRSGSLMSGSYFVRSEKNWSGYEDFASCSRNRPVITYSQGRARWFPGANQAARVLRIPYNTLSSAIRRQVPASGIRARYASSTDDWPNLVKALSRSAENPS